MTTTTPTLGGVTVAWPDVPLAKTEIYNATQRRSANNTLLTSVSGGIKYTWRLKWSCISGAEMAVIKTRAEVVTSQTWQPPDEASSYTCVVKRNSLTITPEPDEDSYTVELELEEA